MKTFMLTSLALFAFAGNSVLCRLALGENTIDAASFTIIRLLSGIVVLAIILKIGSTNDASAGRGSWKASFYLFLYAVTFSFAYISLDTATGALILFGSVQAAMILVGLLTGNKLHYLEWLGVFLAFSGFVYLVLPGLTTPSLTGFILMTIAGIAWAFYTLSGKESKNPLSDTTYNFLRTLPCILILLAVAFSYVSLSPEGIFLAVLSGGITSGIGYAIWYTALGGLSGIQAAVVQLLVPVIAAAGGVVFSGEVISYHLVLSSMMILGGILVVILARHRR
ncbi:DMT family transporter [Pseudomaricurvus alkylphenolicus]|uniref:DMT family transporter n=1 Tax=Pseudomaricurvus alkylphenolicus TaxID=1306991 RepID=UPI00142477E6|nr:DMT family transporter [Pseudomaricurvus alkylphenolicus]NIB41589.1 DMT family transporter [Pseudomaricurvus alkylphenolicus]